MLRIKKLSLENFGPFKGRQDIDFPKDDGVTIVFGENMRGKTSLLNAIRFSLYGKIIGRASRAMSLHNSANWESMSEGTYGFSTRLEFSHAGTDYILRRNCSPRVGIKTPGADDDYEVSCYLERDGKTLSIDERNQELARVMPEQVSRFFLFDGELLQEYEELLRSESDMGRKIAEAIEQILGLPVLQNARADLRHQYNEASKTEARAAQRDLKTQEIGNHLQNVATRKAYQEKELEKLKQRLEQIRSQKHGFEEALRQSEKVRGFLDDADSTRKDIVELELERTDKSNRLKESMRDAWRGILSPRIVRDLAEIQGEIGKLSDQLSSGRLEAAMQAALKTGACPVCEIPINKQSKERIESTLKKKTSAAQVQMGERFRELNDAAAILRAFIAPQALELVAELQKGLNDCHIKLRSKQDRVNELESRIRDVDNAEIRKVQGDYERAIKDMAAVEMGITNTETLLKTENETIKNLEKELGRKGGADRSRESKRRELTAQLLQLFSEGVDVYRDRLRRKVEKDATELFRSLTTEADYTALKINDSYGLTIVHGDGHPIPVRSAGAEHIVALSLLGALQNNAPLQGPIIMDSPFGRLDEAHTTKIVQALPDMADQVVLLVYKAELSPAVARAELESNLRKEYKLVRKSARHTAIQVYRED